MKTEKLKNSKGITLIALIITIIVMLILVGVTVSVAMQGGLFNTASDASKKTQAEAYKEELSAAAAGAYNAVTGEIDGTKLGSNLGAKWSVEGTGPFTCSINGRDFTVSKKGEIIEVNDDVIIQILNQSMVYGQISEEEAFNQLKELLQIDNYCDTMGSFSFGDDNLYIYTYKTDRIYKTSFNENGDVEEFVYADEEQNLEAYKFARKLKTIKSELEGIFKGKTETEMLEKFNSGDLETYVLDNSENINTINIEVASWNNSLRIRKLTFLLDDNEIDFCEYNSVDLIVNDEGMYSGIMLGAGN